jgi:predicted enzyme related to lactoylglutathione lyase
MKVVLDIPVILADDYEGLVNWYKEAMPLEVGDVVSEGYHYTTFRNSGKEIVGIADAREMGVEPPEKKANTVICQIAVSNIRELFARVQEQGGRILFGPKLDEAGGDWYGGFLDIEDNQIWVTEDRNL